VGVSDRDMFIQALRLNIARTLLTEGTWHCDSIDFDVPHQFRNLVGTVTGGFVKRGLMTETSRRPSRKPASNGRKSGVYSLTQHGRARLAGSRGDDVASGSSRSGRPPSARTGFSPQPQAAPSARYLSPQRSGSRLPKTNDAVERSLREDALIKAFEDFEATTVGAEWVYVQDSLDMEAA
jgi:hypothetical protein